LSSLSSASLVMGGRVPHLRVAVLRVRYKRRPNGRRGTGHIIALLIELSKAYKIRAVIPSVCYRCRTSVTYWNYNGCNPWSVLKRWPCTWSAVISIRLQCRPAI